MRIKRLVLLRHAKAVKGWDDFERELNEIGLEDAAEAASAVRSFVGENAVVVCSPAKRTRQTAQIVFPQAPLCFEPSLYLASAQRLEDTVRLFGEKNECVVVVGHNEGLTQAAVRLAQTRFTDHIHTSGFCVLDFDVLGRGTGKLVYYHVPSRILHRRSPPVSDVAR
ncbi:MAG: histidine phosphatase family protein [Bacteroidia bacterium]|nr:histidine phosphatase family protein [Bacteroidia bacterium]